MNDLDQRIGSDLERAAATAPPPVPIETIVSRRRTGVGAGFWPSRPWVVAFATLAALGVALAVFVMTTDESVPGGLAEIEPPDIAPELDASQSPTSVAAAEAEITLQDGLWLSEIIPQIADQLPNITASQLWAALEDRDPQIPLAPTAADLAGVDVPGLSGPQLRWEGLLSPGTYSVSAETSAAEVIEELLHEFTRTVEELNYDQAPETLSLSPYQVVIIASLIEAEGPTNDDVRAKIARVIHNRLAADLTLGLDTPYSYAAQDRDLVLTQAVFEAGGHYETRLEPGFPPTPIAAPSRASLRAAIEPTPGPWLYYVRDDQGTYDFAITLAEHVANVRAAREAGSID